jgi:hypothetical protein
MIIFIHVIYISVSSDKPLQIRKDKHTSDTLKIYTYIKSAIASKRKKSITQYFNAYLNVTKSNKRRKPPKA